VLTTICFYFTTFFKKSLAFSFFSRNFGFGITMPVIPCGTLDCRHGKIAAKATGQIRVYPSAGENLTRAKTEISVFSPALTSKKETKEIWSAIM